VIHATGFVRGWIIACAAVPVFQSIGNDERGGKGGDKGLAASQRSERTLGDSSRASARQASTLFRHHFLAIYVVWW